MRQIGSLAFESGSDALCELVESRCPIEIYAPNEMVSPRLIVVVGYPGNVMLQYKSCTVRYWLRPPLRKPGRPVFGGAIWPLVLPRLLFHSPTSLQFDAQPWCANRLPHPQSHPPTEF